MVHFQKHILFGINPVYIHFKLNDKIIIKISNITFPLKHV